MNIEYCFVVTVVTPGRPLLSTLSFNTGCTSVVRTFTFTYFVLHVIRIHMISITLNSDFMLFGLKTLIKPFRIKQLCLHYKTF